jgi:peptidoglycan/xylan/chitin deacetylase (PgdA/CDA1 family)
MRQHPGANPRAGGQTGSPVAALAVFAAVLFAIASFGATACAAPPHAKASRGQPRGPDGQATGSPSPDASGAPSTGPSGRSGPGGTLGTKPSGRGGPSTSPTGRSPVTAPGPAGSIKNTGSGAVALTFDDGPDPVNTPALLDLLKQHGVKATFCLVGFRARDYPDVVRRIVAEGHTVCNHSWQHLQDLAERDEGYLRWDLKATNDAIHAAAPNAKISYFRAPYGNFTPRLVAFAAELGLKPIHWDVDDETWKTSTYGVGPAMTDHIRYEVQTFTRPGSIILSHENKKPHTITAYATVLSWLQQHFQLVAPPTR